MRALVLKFSVHKKGVEVLVQFSHSVVSDSVTPWTAARQASLSITNSWSSLKLMSIESVMPSNHLILCRPLLLLPSIFPSIRVFSNESVLCIRWPKYWSFNISPSNSYSGMISFRMDWLYRLAVQGTLKNLLSLQLIKINEKKKRKKKKKKEKKKRIFSNTTVEKHQRSLVKECNFQNMGFCARCSKVCVFFAPMSTIEIR